MGDHEDDVSWYDGAYEIESFDERRETRQERRRRRGIQPAAKDFEEVEEQEKARRANELANELAKAAQQLVSALSCPCDYDPKEGPCMQKRAKTRVEDALKEFER